MPSLVFALKRMKASKIIISNRTKQNLLEQLVEREYPEIDGSYDYLINPIIFGCIIILLLAIIINKYLLKKNYPLK